MSNYKYTENDKKQINETSSFLEQIFKQKNLAVLSGKSTPDDASLIIYLQQAIDDPKDIASFQNILKYSKLLSSEQVTRIQAHIDFLDVRLGKNLKKYKEKQQKT